MALPVALLEAMTPEGRPVASWSTVRDRVLVLGRAARDPELNEDAVAAHGLPVVHRRSGGGPVLWDPGLLSLDVVLPAGHPLAPQDVTRAYRWLGAALAEALRGLGLDCDAVGLDRARTLQGRTDDVSVRAGRACFGGVSPYEVLAADGRKVVGLSQARRRGGTLFQCGVLLALDAVRLAELLEPDPREAALLATALAARAAGLGEWLPAVTAADLVAAVEDVLRNSHGVRFAAVVSGRPRDPRRP